MERLHEICSAIMPCNTIADIGCDHGKVSEFILVNALAKNIIVNDISEQSLNKAKDRLLALNLKEFNAKLQFLLCNGSDLKKYDIDCAIIAGIGGRIISNIVKNINVNSLILSPQNYCYGLREYLFECGYQIIEDKTVCDKGKYYDLITAKKGKGIILDDCSRAYGIFYKRHSEELYKRLLADEKAVMQYKQTDENIKKLDIIKKVIKWQQSNK